MKKFVITYNAVILAVLHKPADAKRLFKSINKHFASIKRIKKEILSEDGQPSSFIYLDKHEDDYIYPIMKKEI